MLMLSARGEEYDKLHGFDVGIDDYVVKPFSPKEVMARVNAIVEELRGEKIDIINWSENPALLIENALSPAKVISVLADPDEKSAMVIVPDYQLSLAIGKEGQNARLAARLTGFKIDIKSETQAREAGDFDFYEEEYEEYPEEENYTAEYEENTEAEEE